VKVRRITPPSGRRGHQRVVLEEGLALRVGPEDVAALGLEPGAEIDAVALEGLRRRAEVLLASEIALRLLAVRPRSRWELEERLRRRGIDQAAVDAVLHRLAGAGYVDDLRFARAWTQSRLALRPCGAVRLRRELLRKGVAPGVVDQALRETFAETGERELALEVARARARRYRSAEPEVAYRRLAGVLQRRGFSPGVVAEAVRAVLGRETPAPE